MTDLGTPPGFLDARALALNNSGEVVGEAIPEDFEEEPNHAFLWTEGAMYDLNDLVVEGDELFLTSGEDINDRGMIVGQGRTPFGFIHAYVAIPIVTGDLDDDADVDAADLAWLLIAWGPCADLADCPADLNGDGVVDATDLGILLANRG